MIPLHDRKWHEKPRNVVLLLLFCFPLGLYYMWENKIWTMRLRWLITIGLLFSFVYDVYWEDIIEGLKNWPPWKTEISAKEANAYVEDLALNRGQGILDSYEYSYEDKFRIFIYFSGNKSSNSACLFVVRDNKLELFMHECGSYDEQQNAYNDFVEGLQ